MPRRRISVFRPRGAYAHLARLPPCAFGVEALDADLRIDQNSVMRQSWRKVGLACPRSELVRGLHAAITGSCDTDPMS